MVRFSPPEILGRDKFFSICVPYFNRIHYMKRLLDSFEQFADMPYEMIVHDDASTDGSSKELFEMRDRMSTLIVNTHKCVGLVTSLNRCVEAASSKYIFFLNSDCGITGPCLRTYADMFNSPWAGYHTPHQTIVTGKVPSYFKNGNTKFVIGGGGGGCMIVFNKDMWTDIGGFDERIFSGGADTAMIDKILSRGYFPVSPYVEGEEYKKGLVVANYSYNEQQSQDSTICGGDQLDNSYPKIFKGPQSSEELSRSKHHYVDRWAHAEEKKPEGITNMQYWCNYHRNMCHPLTGVNWEVAAKHGQDKWKEQVEKEIIREQ